MSVARFGGIEGSMVEICGIIDRTIRVAGGHVL